MVAFPGSFSVQVGYVVVGFIFNLEQFGLVKMAGGFLTVISSFLGIHFPSSDDRHHPPFQRVSALLISPVYV